MNCCCVKDYSLEGTFDRESAFQFRKPLMKRSVAKMMVKGIQNSKPIPSAPLLKKTDTKLMGRTRKPIVIAVKIRARTCRPGIKINVNKAMRGKAKNANCNANSYVASCSRTFPVPHVSVAAASGSNTPLRDPSAHNDEHRQPDSWVEDFLHDSSSVERHRAPCLIPTLMDGSRPTAQKRPLVDHSNSGIPALVSPAGRSDRKG